MLSDHRKRITASRRRRAARTGCERRRAGRPAVLITVIIIVSISIDILIRAVYLIREELREVCAYLRCIRRKLYKSCRKHAELYRNDDLLFAVDAKRYYQVGRDFSVSIHIEISSETVRCKTSFAAYIAQFGKPGQECRIKYRRHAHFKKLVRSKGDAGVAIFTLAVTGKLTSRPKLSMSIRSSVTIT